MERGTFKNDKVVGFYESFYENGNLKEKKRIKEGEKGGALY